MLNKIAITGGKGGTGKTLIAVNLAVKLFNDGKNVLLIDCDTENPNTNILLGKSILDDDVIRKDINIFVPEFNQSKCTKCGLCKKACFRHAIMQFTDQFPSVLDHMCSGCRTCERICPENAIDRSSRKIGSSYLINNIINNIIQENKSTTNSAELISPKLDLLIGELNEGEAVSSLIVEEILKQSDNLIKKNINSGIPYDYIIIDTSPGAHCDVEHSLEGADKIICVTEPTPFGLHDLKRIFDLIKIIGKNAQVIINRSSLTDFHEDIYKLIKTYDSKLIGMIPLSNEIIEDYAQGKPFVNDNRNFQAKTNFDEIYRAIINNN